MTPAAAIVDGYSTGNYLPEQFKRLGWRVVHVQSTAELNPSTLLPDLAQYQDNVVCAGEQSIGAAVEALARMGVRAVLAGHDPGGPLADALSQAMGLATNGTRLSRARRDKFDMVETVRAGGLLTARQFKTASPEEVRQWSDAEGYPVVIKPLSSASTDHVTVCADGPTAEQAARAVLDSADIYGQPNREVLAQSYLDGDEYNVDTVSAGGQAHVCGVWLYDKRLMPGGHNIYNRDILCDPAEPAAVAVAGYALDVLGALGIAHGPAHIEVKLTSRGPALVELGARLNGDMHPTFNDACLGANQAALTALAYTDPDGFAKTHGGTVYTRRQPAFVYNAPNSQSGVVKGVAGDVIGQLRELASVHALTAKLGEGQRLVPTTSLLTSPLRVFMTHPDQAQLDRDFRQAERLKDSVYRL
jgi:biotin carboxylase